MFVSCVLVLLIICEQKIYIYILIKGKILFYLTLFLAGIPKEHLKPRNTVNVDQLNAEYGSLSIMYPMSVVHFSTFSFK